jgi:RNA polymerase sigma-70 factor (ECF subfamily)
MTNLFAQPAGIVLHAVPLCASIESVDRRERAKSSAAADRVARLYAAHGGTVYARCRRMLGDAAAAEDITQETFLRVHRAIGSAPGDDGVLPWLYRIATNLCLNALRDGRVRPLLVEDPPDRPSPSPSLDEALTDRDLVARLIARVSRKVQITAWLYYVDGMKQDEVAEVLGVSRRMVAKRLAQFTRKSRQFIRLERPCPRPL